jgi:3-methyl-2-oxobutanoate hydroxymethyltransferase
MAGFTPKPPKLAKAYRNLRQELLDATKEFAEEVRLGQFPTEAQTFH